MKKEFRNSLFLILTALVWGVAFVAQRQGGAAAGPYTFNCIRSFLGAAVLLPIIPFLDGRTQDRRPKTRQDVRRLWTLCGKYVSADGAVLWHHRRQGGISDSVLYSSGAGSGNFNRQKMPLERLGKHSGGGCGTVFFVSDRRIFILYQ